MKALNRQSIKLIVLAKILPLAACTISLGCTSIKEVDPWDRGYLAENSMKWSKSAREEKLKTHIYVSKEVSSGNSGSAGGGCGCN